MRTIWVVIVMVKRFVEHTERPDPEMKGFRSERPLSGMPRYGSPLNFRSWGKCGPRFSRAASC